MSRLWLVLASLVFLLSRSSAFAWTVDFAIGDVNIESPTGEKTPAQAGRVLLKDEVVVTGQGAIALLTDGVSEIRIGSDSRFKISEMPNKKQHKLGLLHVLEGRIRATVARDADDDVYQFEIKARTAVAGVRGTEFYVATEGDEATFSTVRGLVNVRSEVPAEGSWDIPPGRQITKKAGAAPVLKAIDPENLKRWRQQTKIKRHTPVKMNSAAAMGNAGSSESASASQAAAPAAAPAPVSPKKSAVKKK